MALILIVINYTSHCLWHLLFHFRCLLHCFFVLRWCRNGKWGYRFFWKQAKRLMPNISWWAHHHFRWCIKFKPETKNKRISRKWKNGNKIFKYLLLHIKAYMLYYLLTSPVCGSSHFLFQSMNKDTLWFSGRCKSLYFKQPFCVHKKV